MAYRGNAALSDETRIIVIFVTSLLAVLVATPAAIQIAQRIGFYDIPLKLTYKIHKKPTPYLGGAAVLAAVSLSSLTFGGRSHHLTIGLGVAIAFWLIGTLDDGRPLHPIGRLVLEAGAGVPLWLSGLGWNLFSIGIVDLMFTSAWIVVVVNSFNVIDNMDGVAAGLAAVTAAGTAVLGLAWGDVGLAVLAAALAGACTGFLPYNLSSPAKIFLGDGGTMPIGFIMALTVMTLPMDESIGWPVLLSAALLVGVPIFNTVLVTVSRSRRGIPFWIGGTDSVTHRLRTRVSSEHAVALALGTAQAILCALAASLIEIPIVGLESMLAAIGCAALGLILLAVLEGPRWATTSVPRRAALTR